MANPRMPFRVWGLILLAFLLAGTAAFAPMAMAAEGGGEKPAKAEDKSAKDKIREMFGGELIEHLPFPLFSVSVIRDGQVTDQVNFSIVVETKGDANRETVIRERFRVYDAYLRDLYGLLAIKRSDGQLFDPQVVKARLLRVSERLLGPGVVNDILVRGISQRPLS